MNNNQKFAQLLAQCATALLKSQESWQFQLQIREITKKLLFG